MDGKSGHPQTPNPTTTDPTPLLGPLKNMSHNMAIPEALKNLLKDMDTDGNEEVSLDEHRPQNLLGRSVQVKGAMAPLKTLTLL